MIKGVLSDVDGRLLKFQLGAKISHANILCCMTNSNNLSELREKAKLACRLASGASQDHTREYLLASAYGLEKLADAAQKDVRADPNDPVNK